MKDKLLTYPLHRSACGGMRGMTCASPVGRGGSGSLRQKARKDRIRWIQGKSHSTLTQSVLWNVYKSCTSNGTQCTHFPRVPWRHLEERPEFKSFPTSAFDWTIYCLSLFLGGGGGLTAVGLCSCRSCRLAWPDTDRSHPPVPVVLRRTEGSTRTRMKQKRMKGMAGIKTCGGLPCPLPPPRRRRRTKRGTDTTCPHACSKKKNHSLIVSIKKGQPAATF